MHAYVRCGLGEREGERQVGGVDYSHAHIHSCFRRLYPLGVGFILHHSAFGLSLLPCSLYPASFWLLASGFWLQVSWLASFCFVTPSLKPSTTPAPSCSNLCPTDRDSYLQRRISVLNTHLLPPLLPRSTPHFLRPHPPLPSTGASVTRPTAVHDLQLGTPCAAPASRVVTQVFRIERGVLRPIQRTDSVNDRRLQK